MVGSALLHPGATSSRSLARSVLAQPRIFDVISAIAQWRDENLVKRAHGAYLEKETQVQKAHDHNLSQIKKFTRTRRAEYGYEVLTTNLPGVSDKELLVVGGRSVQEFLLAWTFGFSWKNMVGIDLFSATKKILAMNVEKMTFPDASFDAVISINTFGYTDRINDALRECARVLKPNGRFVFNHDYRPDDPNYPVMKLRGRDIAAILQSAGFEIYFHASSDKVTSGVGYRQTQHMFGCCKIPTDDKTFDAYRVY
jgi:hypothetical protein